MLEPFENRTIVCKLAGVDALLIIAVELLLLSVFESLMISSGVLYDGCLSVVMKKWKIV